MAATLDGAFIVVAAELDVDHGGPWRLNIEEPPH